MAVRVLEARLVGEVGSRNDLVGDIGNVRDPGVDERHGDARAGVLAVPRLRRTDFRRVCGDEVAAVVVALQVHRAVGEDHRAGRQVGDARGRHVRLNAADDRQELIDGPMNARGQVRRLLCVRAFDDDRDHAPERLDGGRDRHDERKRDDERSKRAHRARPLDREGVGHAATPATRLSTTESRSSVSNGLFM